MSPTAAPVLSLPTVLAGPQVRRAETARVFLWLATSVAAQIEADVFDAAGARLGGAASAAVRSVQLGERLFVHLIEARPDGGAFPEDALLAYDLRVNGANLGALGLLGADGVALPGFALPGFYIPRELATVLVGSCRKPHGGNPLADGTTSDALAYACDLLEEDARDLALRPAALLSLGDQIYADDVPGALLAALKPLATALIGREEVLPQLGALSNVAFGEREALVKEHGLTTGHGEHHLLGLGEFAAMYIVTCGGVLPSIPAWDALPPGRPRKPAETTAARMAYEGSATFLQSYLEGCARVRRLLANVVSYSVFDDHEVTDDWNIDQKMKSAIGRDLFTRRVVGNALMSYWAFQAWGNDPDQFTADFTRELEAGALDHSAAGIARQAADTALLECHNWQFVTPTEPPVFFMDARTQRKFGGYLGLAELLDEGALDWLARALAERANRERPAYIVAPTPVYGFTPIEFLQGIVKKLLTLVGLRASAIDCESWITVREGYYHLMRMLLDARESDVVFLSGDVHYGFVKSGVFEHRNETVAVTQLTSSALHNYPPSAPTLRWLGVFDKTTERRTGFVGRGIVQDILRWTRWLWVDGPVYFGLWRPDTKNGNAWFDIARLYPISDRDCRIVPESHVGVLTLANGKPVSFCFRHPRESEIAGVRLGPAAADSAT